MLPTFIGIGAQRAGTTWAYNCLAEHPDVFMTRKKELHFFYVNYDKGLDWYRSQFEEARECRARGEITPDYMYHERAIANIARDVPEARLFVILRNPIDRAISAFVLHRDRFGSQSFAEACDSDPELIDRGLYYKHLSNVLRHFERQRLGVLFYDDLIADPRRFVAKLYQFVGVRSEFRPDSLKTRYNRVIYPDLQKALIGTGLGWTIDLVKRTGMGGWIRRRHSGDRRESGIAAEDDVAMLRHAYQQDVAALSDLVGRDLRGWLR